MRLMGRVWHRKPTVGILCQVLNTRCLIRIQSVRAVCFVDLPLSKSETEQAACFFFICETGRIDVLVHIKTVLEPILG